MLLLLYIWDVLFTAGCLETISNVTYNISDLSNDKYPRQMYLFECLNHFYRVNN